MRRYARSKVLRPKRNTDWVVSAVGSANELDLANQQSLFLYDSLDADDHDDNVTVRRIVGTIAWLTITEPALSHNYNCFWGIYKTTENASGILSLDPSSFDDADNPHWMLRHFSCFPDESKVGNSMMPANIAQRFYHSWSFDTRVMRKVQGNESIVLTYKITLPQNIVLGPAVEFANIRTLVSLS